MHQLRSDIEASNSQAVEKEETARKEIEELKLQIQEFLLAREHEKNVSANCEATLFTLFRKVNRCARISLLVCLGDMPLFVVPCLL